MWNQPHFFYRFDWSPRDLAQFDPRHLEGWVPGVLVYAYVNRKRARLNKLEPDAAVDYIEVFAPIHGAWLVETYLQRLNIRYESTPRYVNGLTCWTDSDRPELEARGRELLDSFIERGIVRYHVKDLITPYQAMGIAWAEHRPWVMNVWACGSGKTLGGLLASLTRTGPTLVLCPAKARHVWWSQVQEYTLREPFRVRPKGERKKGDETLESYLQRMGTRAFVIVGVESIHEYMSEVRATAPTTLVYDELHLHGSAKRWKAIHNEDGTVDFAKKTTKANKETRAAVMMDVSRLPSVELRIGMTATPLDDGRPRRLWSQYDLLTIGGFAHSYRRFAERYCAATPGQYGGLDDRGSSNLDELRNRSSFFMHEVPYNESHDALPSTRVQVVYLDRCDLGGAGRYNDEQTFGQAIRSLTRSARTDFVARERLVEARLAEACSRKRPFVIDEVKQGVRGGGKVVVFTARRAETEIWTAKVRKALSEGDEKLAAVDVWMAHGGISESERDRITDTFKNHPGPCVLIATGQSVGTGVDGMQTADLAIFAMLPWKPGDFTQWKGRFDRLGGRPTLLKVVVAQGTYDERVVEILVEKFGPIETFLAADELTGLDAKLLGLEDEETLISNIVGRLSVET